MDRLRQTAGRAYFVFAEKFTDLVTTMSVASYPCSSNARTGVLLEILIQRNVQLVSLTDKNGRGTV